MMRSFHYACHIALREPGLRALAEGFAAALAGAFREAYFSALKVPASRALLEGFMLEKAVYELNYELNNRPDWAEIPLLGLKQLVTEY
jgi:maltose alpha-D-glucosyltransferase/alpha-amylase